jgi:8-oxo-dGTP pyrophosphatase MutT (NUDIX family)
MTIEYKKAVQVILINESGEVLAVSRKDDHTKFGLPGGKVDETDKNEIEAAIREVKEETGLDISNLHLVFAMHRNGYMGFTYLADYTGEIHTDEPHVVKWAPYSLLFKGPFAEWNLLASKSLDSLGIQYLKEYADEEKNK